MKVNVQVSNTGEAIEGLREYGVKAMAHKTLSNEIVVDSEDKKKVVRWMTGPGGFDLEDIKKMYSELLESNLSLDETIRLINVNESSETKEAQSLNKAWDLLDKYAKGVAKYSRDFSPVTQKRHAHQLKALYDVFESA